MKSRLLLGILMICLATSTTGFARDLQLNKIMAQIGKDMTELYPLIYAERELTSKEISLVSNSLSEMSTLFGQAAPYIKQRATTYEVSYKFIKPYLSETIGAFKSGNIDFGRSRLYGISAICTSCHTQDTHLRTMFSGINRESFNSDYVFAEFNYLTRNYKEAERYFDKHLRNEAHKTEYQIIKPIQRLITIYTQIYNRPADGAKLLQSYQSLPDHTPETKAALAGWIKGLNELDKQGAKRVQHPDFNTLKTYVKQYLGDLEQPLSELYINEDEQISRVWLRGQLYHYLNRSPKADEIPQILFWLSICDRSIGYNFYFSLADLYLKDCVYNYSKHPYAKKCYAEYKEFVTTAYTGSGGTFLPAEIEDELFDMKKKLGH